jgi:hypothetical protein
MTNSLKLTARRTNRFDPLLVAAILATSIALIPRIVPDRSSDRGIFISVAARLLAGDTLYSGVWDNKEPLFYYFVAAQLTLGRWSEVAAEALLVAIAASAAFLLAVKLASRWTAMAISFIAVPIILTGEFYYPGYTELPGIALTLVAITASAFERSALAGFCIGLLIFTKLIYVPIALLGVSCFSLTDRRFFDFISIALGASVSVALIVGVLFTRNELSPFLETIMLNIAHSHGNLIGSKKGLASLVEHMRLAGLGGWNLLAKLVPILLGIMVALIILSSKPGRKHTQIAISATCVLTFVGSLAVLSVTGYWDIHRQILYIPSIITLISLSSLLDASVEVARLRTLGLIFLIGLMMSGTLTLQEDFGAVRSFRGAYAAFDEVSPETRRLLAIGSSGTYARLGQNDDDGHAAGLSNWKLACPRFHQYPFYSATVLNEILECASTVPVLIVSAGIAPQPDWPSWNEFVASVENLLAHNYSCDANSGLRICTRFPNR